MNKRILIAYDYTLEDNLGLEIAYNLKADFTLIIHNQSGTSKIKNYKGHDVEFIGTGNNFLKDYSPSKLHQVELDASEYHNCFSLILRYRFQYESILITKPQIDNFIKKILSYALELLINKNINFVILPEIPHQKLDYFIFLASKSLNLRQIFISGFPTVDSNNIPIFISDKYGSFGSLLNLKLDQFNIDQFKQENPLYPYYLAYKQEENSKFKQVIATINHPNFLNLTSNKLRHAISYIRFNGIRSLLIKILNSLLGNIIIIIHRLYSPIVLNYYKKKSEKTFSQKTKFIYFPLHFQPESTTTPAGNEFSDQLKVIESLASYLPDNVEILVKEHPAYLVDKAVPISLHRGIKFYKKILKYNQCKLIDINLNSYDLIKESISVVTVTGTVSLEALANNKPSINYGNSKYNEFPNSILISNLNGDSLINRIEKVTSNLNDKIFPAVLNELSKIFVIINSTNQGYKNSLNFEKEMKKKLIANLSKYRTYLD